MKKQHFFKGLKRSLLFIVGSFFALLITAFFVFQSSFGKQKLFAFVLSRVNASSLFHGHLSIGYVETNYLSSLTLHDVLFTDQENEKVIFLKKIVCSFQGRELWDKRLHITSLQFEGSEVELRKLADGHLNIVSLFQPISSASSTRASPSSFSIQIDQIQGSGDLGYVIPLYKLFSGILPSPYLTGFSSHFTLEGNLMLKNEEFRMQNIKIKLQTLSPFPATLHVEGGFTQKEKFVLDPTTLSMSFPSQGIKKWFGIESLGLIKLDTSVQGPLSQLQVKGALTTEAGLLEIAGQGNVENENLPWSVELKSQHFRPSVFYPPLSKSEVAFSLQGRGDRKKGQFEIKNFKLALWDSHIEAQIAGAVDFVRSELLWASSSLSFDIPDLSSLPLESLSPKQGILSGKAHLFYALGSVEAALIFSGKKIHLSSINIKQIESRLQLQDNQGLIELTGNGVQLGDLLFRTLSLQGTGNPQQISIKSKGQGPYQTLFQFEASARPQNKQNQENFLERFMNLDAQLFRFHLSKAGQTWSLQKPTFFQISFLDPFSVHLKPFLLGSGKQRISLQGNYQHDEKRFDFLLKSQRLDLQKIAGLFWKEPFLPHTSLGFSVAFSGNLHRTFGKIQIQGTSSKFAPLAWQETQYSLSAHMNTSAVTGQFNIKSQRTDIKSKFQIPFSLYKKVALEVQGYGPIPLFQKFFPPSLEELQGNFAFEGKLWGTLHHPQFVLKTKIPEFQSKKVLGKETLLSVEYNQGEAKLTGNSTFFTQAGVLLGKAKIDVSAPLVLSLPINKKGFLYVLGHAPLSGIFSFDQVQVNELARLVSLEQSEVQVGDLQGDVKLSGTLANPKMDLHMDSHQVFIPRWLEKSTTLSVNASYQGDLIEFQGALTKENKTLASTSGKTTLSTMFSETGTGWREAPISMDAVLYPLPLHLSMGLTTQLEGKLKLGGTLGHILWNINAVAKQTQLSRWNVGEIRVDASPEGENSVFAHIAVNQAKGGQLTAQVHFPLFGPFDVAKVYGDVVSQKYEIDYKPQIESAGELLILQGLVTTNIQFAFPEGQPKVTGQFNMLQGAIGIRSEPRQYQNITLDFSLVEKQPEQMVQMTLKKLEANVSGGTLSLFGTVDFRGAKLEHASLFANSKHFPLSKGNVGMWLDGNIDISAKIIRDYFDVDLFVKNGSVQVPQLSSDDSRPLLDFRKMIVYTNQKDTLSKNEKQQALPSLLFLKSIPRKAMIHLHIKEDNPLVLKGAEVKGTATGAIDVELDTNGLVKPTGSLFALTGSVQLFNKDYDVNQAEVSFDGTMTPIVNIRLSRPFSGGTLYVEAQGPINKLRTSLRTDPPDYSQSEILALFRGDAPESGASKGQGALNIFSSLVVDQIRQQFGESAKYLFIDTVRVDEDLTNSKEGSARLELGKNFSVLGGTVYVSYIQQFGGETIGTRKQNRYQGRVEFRLFREIKLPKILEFLRNVQLDGSYGDAGVGNIDISYHTRRF